MGSISTSISLPVIVVGGGICGLSAAIALRRAGHNVTVYEKYPADADAGAGIVICSNAVRVLRQWDLDLEGAGMFQHKSGYIVDGTTLKVLNVAFGEDSQLHKENDSGDATYMTTRRDLRMLLRDEAEREVLGQGTIDFLYGLEVVDYDAERPAVKLADGTWVDSALVVACDGIRSRAAKVICGYENPALPTGRSALRLLIPDEHLKAVKERYKDDEFISDRFRREGTIWFACERERLMIWWTSRFGQIHAFDVVMPDDEKFTSKEDWTAKCDKQLLLEEFAHWHPLYRDLFDATDNDPMLWKICAREPLKTLRKGKLIMLGDALHPMPPFRAQGATQSIEDTGALEIVLTALMDESELSGRLEILDKLRVPRYSCAQLMSTVRQDELNMEEKLAEVMDQCRQWFDGKDQSHLDSRANLQKWLVSYDVREAARHAMAAWN